MADEINIKIDHDLSENKIFSIEKDGHVFPLSSRIDAEGVSELYSKRYGNDKFFNTIILFGFSDGRIIRNFLKNMSEGGGIIVFEPSEEIFKIAKKEFAVDDIINDKRVTIVTGKENLLTLFVYVMGEIPINMAKDLQYAVLPNYDVIFYDICKKWQDLIFSELINSDINNNTLINLHDKFVNNFIDNMPLLIRDSDITMLIDNFKRYDFADIPAIIVGAGPSLDKNIKYLKDMERKVFIIATDASLKTLVKYGIRCHLAINADLNMPSKFFEDPIMKNIGLVTGVNANKGLLSVHPINNFYLYSSFEGVCDGIFGKTYDHEYYDLESGGSVSCNAYSLAKLLGFKKIIFIGQDLAYTGGKLHTDTFNKAHDTTDEKFKEGRTFVKVEDWDGNELETDFQMAAYLKWFNKKFEIDELDNIKIYDATEGGAKKEHAERIALNEALMTLTSREIDFFSIINNTRKTFSKKSRSKAIKKLRRVPTRLRHLRSELYEKKEHFLLLSNEYNDKSNDPAFLKKLMKGFDDSLIIKTEPKLLNLIYFENGYADNALNNVIFDEHMPFDKVLKTYSDYFNKYYETCSSLIDRIEDKWKNIS
jgi:hypothetical protein